MKLTMPAPPREIKSALKAGLTNFVEPNDPLAGLPYHEAHEVFSLPLDKAQAVTNGVDLNSKAISTGWRFMAAEGRAHLGCHVGGTGPKVMGVTRTPAIHHMLHHLRQLDEHMRKPPAGWPEMHGQNYELRALRIPGLLIEAFWLYCPGDSGHDHVVPYAGFVEDVGLDPMRAYSAEDFLKAIQHAPKGRLQKHSPDKAPKAVTKRSRRRTAPPDGRAPSARVKSVPT